MSNALSYVHGAMDTPMIGETIGVAFDKAVARHGDRPGLTVRQQDIRWSYRELGERVHAFAAGCWRWGWSPATGWRSGRRIAPNG